MSINMRSEYADHLSTCCGEPLHRPAPAESGDPFFCMACGEVDAPSEARRLAAPHDRGDHSACNRNCSAVL